MKVWKKSEKSNDKNSWIQHHSHPTRVEYCSELQFDRASQFRHAPPATTMTCGEWARLPSPVPVSLQSTLDDVSYYLG